MWSASNTLARLSWHCKRQAHLGKFGCAGKKNVAGAHTAHRPWNCASRTAEQVGRASPIRSGWSRPTLHWCGSVGVAGRWPATIASATCRCPAGLLHHGWFFHGVLLLCTFTDLRSWKRGMFIAAIHAWRNGALLHAMKLSSEVPKDHGPDTGWAQTCGVWSGLPRSTSIPAMRT